jgi:hypothetical protein
MERQIPNAFTAILEVNVECKKSKSDWLTPNGTPAIAVVIRTVAPMAFTEFQIFKQGILQNIYILLAPEVNL